MNPYDKEKTREIWKRVLGEEESCECRAFDSERLRAMITAEKNAVCTYRAMARCTEGRCRELLCCFARDALAHSKKLETVYFLWTGECACAMSDETPQICCIADSLREMYRRETETSGRFRRTSEELPDYAEVFFSIAQEKMCRAEKLMKLLMKYV